MKISATAAYVQELYLKSAENNGLALGVGFVSYEVIQMIWIPAVFVPVWGIPHPHYVEELTSTSVDFRGQDHMLNESVENTEAFQWDFIHSPLPRLHS